MIEHGNKIEMEMGLRKNINEIFLSVVGQGKKLADWVPEMSIVPKEKKGMNRQKFTHYKEDETNINQSIIGPEPSIPLSDIYGRIESL